MIKRGGGPIEVRASWAADPDPAAWLTKLAKLQNSQAIPGRVAYDLHRIAQVYESWPSETVKDAIQRDVLRIIRAKQPREAGGLEMVREPLARVSSADSLRKLADELLIARQIAAAMGQAEGRKPAEGAPP